MSAGILAKEGEVQRAIIQYLLKRRDKKNSRSQNKKGGPDQ